MEEIPALENLQVDHDIVEYVDKIINLSATRDCHLPKDKNRTPAIPR